MSVALRVCLVGLALVLTAAGARAQVYRGNDTGGIIPWSCENEAAARDIAGAHCAGWNKVARITSARRMYGEFISFNCLWRPNVARYQIPAVGTRASCDAHARAPRLNPRVRARY